MRLRSRRAREKAAEVVAVAKPGPARDPEEPALEPRYAHTACGFEKSMFDTPDLQLENCERCLGSDPRRAFQLSADLGWLTCQGDRRCCVE